MAFAAFDFSTLGLYRERLCMDFANTTPYHHDLSEDHLQTYADLLAWSMEVHLLNEDEAEHLHSLSLRRPGEAAAVLQKAVALREIIFALLSDVAGDRPPRAEALAPFNAALTKALAHLRLAPADAGVRWDWAGGEDDLERMLWPVAWSTVEVLTSHDRMDLRVCEGHDCDWLFMDTSRNHSRRWCSMETCGNRAKARRHYQRARGE